MVGIGRTGGGAQGIVSHLVTAMDWKDPTSYVGRWTENLFPDTTIMPAAGVEDPHVYMGEGGVFHAVFHNQIQDDDEKLCGGHAYSTDGIKWVFTGTAFGSTVSYTDGSTYAFSRRERPHMVFGDKARPLTVTALSTGVQFGRDAPVSTASQDACYTLLQHVATNADEAEAAARTL